MYFYSMKQIYYPKQFFMKAKPQSTSIANYLKQGLLKKTIAQITKRQFLFKNMNIYSVGQISNVIQQISQQQVMTVASTSITQTEDFNSNPIDNMMSMSDIKMQETTQISDDYQSECRSKTNEEAKIGMVAKNKQDKLIIIDLVQESNSIRNKVMTCHSLKDEEQDIEESREIQAFRLMKHREYEEKMKMMSSEKQKKIQPPINLNNERVMFSYDSKIVKLDKLKQKQNQNISRIQSSLILIDDEEKLKNRNLKLMTNKIPTVISNKVNITQKQAQQQRQKSNRYRKHPRISTSTQGETPSSLIRVNPESHKQHEMAITVREPGVKISIQQKQYSLQKSSPRLQNNKRLTRSEYLQIKSNQQIRDMIRRSNVSMVDRLKVVPVDKPKTEFSKKYSSNHQKNEKKNRFYLTPFQIDFKRDKSKILTHSLEGKQELIHQVKQKPFLFETIDDQPKKNELSTIDKYNLLYVKFKGNPPKQSSDKIISQLQSQSNVLKTKPSLMTVYSKKSSIKRENRLINRIK